MKIILNGTLDEIRLFKIHADYLPIKEQRVRNYYYVYAWSKSEVAKFLKDKAPWLKIYNMWACSNEERQKQENLPDDLRFIMNEDHYTKIRQLIQDYPDIEIEIAKVTRSKNNEK